MEQPDFHSRVARKRHVKVPSSRRRHSKERSRKRGEEKKIKSEVCTAVSA